MEIQNPRRILAVALTEAQEYLSRVLRDLSGAPPEPSAETGRLAGTTHTLPLTTAYYSAQVPVWVDLVGGGEEEKTEGASPETSPEKTSPETDDHHSSDDDPHPTTPRQWADAFLGADARDVRAALGGVVAVVAVDGEAAGRPLEFVEQVGRLVRGLATTEEEDNDDIYSTWDGVALVAGVIPPGTTPAPALVDAWDDVCAAAGLEFVLVGGASDTNAFGETTGVPRVLEALQANEWGGDVEDVEDLDGFLDDHDSDNDSSSFDPDRFDLGLGRADFAGLREAIWRGGDVGERAAERARAGEEEEGGGDDNDPGDLAALMGKLLAVREQGARLPAAQRRRLAAQAVGEVLREVGRTAEE